MMEDFAQSEQLGDLLTAMAAAQAEMGHAHKNAKNPHFKSEFADLPEVIDTIRPVMTKHGLSFMQFPVGQAGLMNFLGHKSGQWLRGKMQMTPKDSSPQAVGSCLTYARRYSGAGIANIGQSDDDGNAASQQAKPATTPQKPKQQPKTTAKNPPGYDGSEAQQKVLARLLTERGVPEHLWEKIGERFMGKPSTEIVNIINQVREEADDPTIGAFDA